MNQTQANRVVKLINFLENEPEGFVFDLGTVAYEAEWSEVSINGEKVGEADLSTTVEELLSSGDKCEIVKETHCGTCACLAGSLPYIFPKIFEKTINEEFNSVDFWLFGKEDDGSKGKSVTYLYPNIIQNLGIDVSDWLAFRDPFEDEDQVKLKVFCSRFFGLPYKDIDNMFKRGIPPEGYRNTRKYKTDKDAVLAYLTDQLNENGYTLV